VRSSSSGTSNEPISVSDHVAGRVSSIAGGKPDGAARVVRLGL
jgi:hypothetical protein